MSCRLYGRTLATYWTIDVSTFHCAISMANAASLEGFTAAPRTHRPVESVARYSCEAPRQLPTIRTRSRRNVIASTSTANSTMTNNPPGLSDWLSTARARPILTSTCRANRRMTIVKSADRPSADRARHSLEGSAVASPAVRVPILDPDSTRDRSAALVATPNSVCRLAGHANPANT